MASLLDQLLFDAQPISSIDQMRLPGPLSMEQPPEPITRTTDMGEVGGPTPTQMAPQPETVPEDRYEFLSPPSQSGLPLPPSPPPISPASGGRAVLPEDPAQPAAPSAIPAPRAMPRADGRDQLRAVGQVLMRAGSPALRVQGMQMLFEANQPTPEEREEMEFQRNQRRLAVEEQRKRQQKLLYDEEDYFIKQQRAAEEGKQTSTRLGSVIDTSIASEDEKARAKTLLQLGAKPEEIAGALQFNNQGAVQRRELADKSTRQIQALGDFSRDTGVMKDAALRAEKLIDKGTMTTGLKGYVGQMVPGSDANRLVATLEPMQRIIGFNRLQAMREASKTGGALGSVSDKEGGWLAAVEGSLDPINNDPKTLKENIAGVLAGREILAKMRRLVPALDAGDQKAMEAYADLSEQLGNVGATVRQRMEAAGSAPPMEGARKAKDGNWYVETAPGKFSKVVP